MQNPSPSEVKYQIAGWVLFILCAVLFLLSSLKNRDGLGLAASIVFLAACMVFLIPLVGSLKKR